MSQWWSKSEHGIPIFSRPYTNTSKARVTLARALYSSASILLLDDVLAALDVHTAKWVVNNAFTGDLVAGRTVLLVTHNIALTAPVADFALVLGKHGRIAEYGSVADVLRKDARLRRGEKQDRAAAGVVDELARELIDGVGKGMVLRPLGEDRPPRPPVATAAE